MLKRNLKKLKKNVYELPRQDKMLVPARIISSENLIKFVDEESIKQLSNVSKLPGILKYSIAMSDIHLGYGFPIGGVAAFDKNKGVITPGGIGYDIGCGVRLLSSNITKKDFLDKRKNLVERLYKKIPSGVGKEGFLLSDKDISNILKKGVGWAIENGYGLKEDIEKIEDGGCLSPADPAKVSQKAKARGRKQLGTIGSGNHFIEIQFVEEVFDKEIAKVFGIGNGVITIMIHTGSRGLGHQTASDYLLKMDKIGNFIEKDLINAPIKSSIGEDYISAMNCAANFAFTNRQIITHLIREVFEEFFPGKKLDLVYDISHNIAKFENHSFNGKSKEVCVCRKGATRSFGPGREEIPKRYRKYGCPIFIPGSMGTSSYVLCGTKIAEKISFGSAPHGAGRLISRSKAMKDFNVKSIRKELELKDILIKSESEKNLIQESPQVYKDVEEVVKASEEAGICKKVAKMKPLAVVK